MVNKNNDKESRLMKLGVNSMVKQVEQRSIKEYLKRLTGFAINEDDCIGKKVKVILSKESFYDTPKNMCSYVDKIGVIKNYIYTDKSHIFEDLEKKRENLQYLNKSPSLSKDLIEVKKEYNKIFLFYKELLKICTHIPRVNVKFDDNQDWLYEIDCIEFID